MDYNLPYQQQQAQSFQQVAQAFQQQSYQPITATFPSASNDPHYKGYEAAVIEHAKLLQVQQAKEKLFGVPSRKPFVGQWKKKGPPKEPVDPRKYFCELCVVTCAGDESYQTHLQGKSHKHKEALKTGRIKLDTTRPGYHCEVCNATCSAKDAFHAHLNGAKHNRAIKTLQMLGKPVPEYLLNYHPQGDPMQNLPVQKKVVGVSATKFVGGVKLSTTHGEEEEHAGNGNDQDGSSFTPIGEEFVEVILPGPTVGRKPGRSSYRCKICECVIGDPAARDLHVRGRRHRLAYRQKIDPTISVEEKNFVRGGPNDGAYIPNHQPPAPKPTKTNRSIASKLNQPTRPKYSLPSVNNTTYTSLPDTTSSDSFDEQFAQLRLDKIQPDDDFTQKIEEMIESVERGLKKISDVLVEKSDENDSRLLRGVVRVGPLGEGIILNFDKTFHVVLLCKDIPTVSLIKQIVEDLPNHLDTVECDSEGVRERFTFELLLDDSAFKVYYKTHDITCIVTLTSVVLRSVNESENGNKEGDEPPPPQTPIVKPADALPEEPCLRALAELRHAKFFQAQSKEIPNLTEIVMLLRDIGKRIDTWSVLTLYHIQLLVYKTLSSHSAPLRISDGLRRFFEMIACGTFMAPYSKLIDPCEKEETNALSEISPQQRENLVCSAQHGLRLITFDQIYTILAVDKNSLNGNRKRPAENGESENEAKKAKQKGEIAVDPGLAQNKPVMPPSHSTAFKHQ